MTTTISADEPVLAPTEWTEHWVVSDLRALAAASTAGLVLGVVVNGFGGRLAMMLLARLNPGMTGVTSDDGFRIGQFTLDATMGLVLFATGLGVLGGVLFLLLRDLRVGPPWFRTTSMTVGPAVVVGSTLVHTEGIDFRMLEPAWVAVTLFVVLPGLFAHGMVRMGDWWLRDGSWFRTGSRWRLLTLASLALAAPALPVLLLVAAIRCVYRLVPNVRAMMGRRSVLIACRMAMTALVVVALVDLIRDTRELL